MSSILILGAGLAGLAAARELTRLGHTIRLLDKGRRVGGRLATRRLGNGLADHGAQYFSAQSPDFKALTNQMLAVGVVQEWHLEQSDPASFRHPRYVGTAGMNGIARFLAEGLAVDTGQRAVHLAPTPTGWQVTTETRNTYLADALLLTLPAPQALALCHQSGLGLRAEDEAALKKIEYQPCLAVLLLLSQPTRLPAPGGLKFAPERAVAWLADNQQKGISPGGATLTLHASHTYSHAHLDTADLPTLIPELLAGASAYVSPQTVIEQHIHRWRYSNATVRHQEPYLAAAGFAGPLLFGGDGFGMGNIEGAFTSGLAMARCFGPAQTS